MFRCPIKKQVSRPGEKPVKVVLETREKVYHKKVKSKEKNEFGLSIYIDKEVGRGFEIVKEIMVRKEALEDLKK